MISLGLGLWSTTILSRLGFSPSALFANGEVGVWYDPSPETTFTDTAGTTPATVGDAVALMLDKSKGLVLGPELVTNGTFDTDTDWTKGTGWTISGGVATKTAGTSGGLSQTVANVSGRTYLVTVDIVRTAGLVNVTIGGAGAIASPNLSASGTYTFRLLSGSAGTVVIFASGDFAGSIDNISVKELPGYHATQGTTAARPILARVPASGRRNLLTRTEEFESAAWVTGPLGTATVTKSTANAASAPDGTMTADRVLFSLNGGTTTGDIALLRQAATAPAGPATHSVYLRAFDGVSSYVMQIIAADGSAQNITVTGDWQRFSVTATASGSTLNYGVRLRGGQSPANSDSADILLWGAQVEVGSTASAYQKVTSTYDVTEAGQADNYFLWFDGVDDYLVLPAADYFGAESSVFVGIQPKTPANGLRTIGTPSNTSLEIATDISAGVVGNFTVGSGRVIYNLSQASPMIQTWTRTVAGNSAILRSNGVQRASTTHDQTGLNEAIALGARPNGSLFSPMDLYSLIIRRALTEGNTLTQTEKYVSTKTAGVSI